MVRDPAQWNQVGFVTGHLPWEVRDLLPAGTRTVTVLRDPVDRTLSHYWQLSINPDVKAESPGFSLEEFVESPRWNTLCRDYQARQLAHRIDVAHAGKTYVPADRFAALGPPFPREHQYPLQSLFDCSPLTLSGAALERAALGALAEIEFVGVTRHLDALYGQVAAAGLGAPRAPAARTREHRLRSPPPGDDLGRSPAPDRGDDGRRSHALRSSPAPGAEKPGPGLTRRARFG